MEKASTAPIHKNRTTTLGRISGKITTGGPFRNISLQRRLYPEIRAVTSLDHWAIPNDSSGEWEKYPFSEAIKQTFTAAKVGDSFGPTWTTHWFKIVLDVPAEWAGKEVHFRWATGSEGLIYNADGKAAQGLSPGYREEYKLPVTGTTGSRFTYYVEMSCNDMFGAGDGDLIAPTSNNRYYTLGRCEIGLFDRDIYNTITHLDVLNQIANQMPNDHRGYQAMFCANEMINLIEVDDDFAKAREIAEQFFSEGGGTKNHTLVSMGHCHIDTAWLWPYEETKRKVARSWSAQIRLLRDYPDTVFTASSAQQFEWLAETHPNIFNDIKAFINPLEGGPARFIPVGGTWIEMDGNIPSGESFIRQFLYGQKYFQEQFNGWTCKEFWLPDTFGYAAQIPQILQHVGIGRFLTQKMSWNLVNKFPHHNFLWEGIDGSQVLTHFPPGDSYNMNGNVSEMLFSVNNSQDKGRCNTGIYLYGNGDGGGGPTMAMIEKQNRCKNVDGLPKIVYEGPDYFFQQLEKEQDKLCKWVGELYLELHNGTYTSQAKIKWYNRKGEFFLREVEQLVAMAAIRQLITSAKFNVDRNVIDRCWKDLMLNQFHDILPGSCVQIAAQRAWERYMKMFEELTRLRSEYHGILLGTGTTKYLFNYLPWEVEMVVLMKPNGELPAGENIQSFKIADDPFEGQGEGQFRVPNEFSAALVRMDASGYAEFTPLVPKNPVTVVRSGDGSTVTYDNGILNLVVPATGIPNENSLTFKGQGEKVRRVFNDRLGLGINAGTFYIYNDIPLYWDAWDVMDYHLETRRELEFDTMTEFTDIVGTGTTGIAGIYKFTGTFGNGSSIERYTIMRADSPMIEYYTIVDWKEENKMLKVEFPVDVLSREATYEIQYGHAKRPTHMNTSWDMAKFEVCGHKWMDISQADKGVAFITDSKYGWHVRDNIVKLSLLKSPKNPDAVCDMHKHYIYYAVMPHEGTLQQADVIRRAYELNVLASNNVPLINGAAPDALLPKDWIKTDGPEVIVEAFKTAYYPSGYVGRPVHAILRLYESHGGETTTTVTVNFPYSQIEVCNGMEEAATPPEVVATTPATSFQATFRPFEIKSYLVTL